MMRTCIEIESLRRQYEEAAAQHVVLDPATITASNLAGVDNSASLALSQVLRQVQPLAGVHFLRGLIDAMCETFGTQYAGICLADKDEPGPAMQSIFYRSKTGQGDPFRYEISGTPCSDVINQGRISVTHGLAKKYPADEFFTKNNIETYVGIRLMGPDNKEAIGVTWLLDERPLSDAKPIEVVLRYFAPRIAAELIQLQRYETLLLEHEAMEGKLAVRSGVDCL
jgi:GAF domain-containing protein